MKEMHLVNKSLIKKKNVKAAQLCMTLCNAVYMYTWTV